MVVKRQCSFCAGEVEPGTGTMFVKRDGTVYYFCSSSCRKQQLHLGRVGHRLKWTRAHAVKRAQAQSTAQRTGRVPLPAAPTVKAPPVKPAAPTRTEAPPPPAPTEPAAATATASVKTEPSGAPTEKPPEKSTEKPATGPEGAQKPSSKTAKTSAKPRAKGGKSSSPPAKA